MTAPRTCVHFSLYLPQASRDARDDKGERGASIWCDGNNGNLTDGICSSSNPQACGKGVRRTNRAESFVQSERIHWARVLAVFSACNWMS